MSGVNFYLFVSNNAVINGVKELERAHPAVLSLEKQVKRMKILVVDDNAVNYNLSRVMLEAQGHEVVVATEGLEAIEALTNDDGIDIVFMDLRMPRMNGIDATKKIRKFNKKVPIVALTLNDGPDQRSSCFKAGMNDFLEKPVKNEEFQEMIEKWVGKS